MLNKKSNFIINFLELQYRFIYLFISFILSFICSFIYKIELFYSISTFFLEMQNYFIYTSILDPIFVYVKLSILNSIIFSFPVFLYLFIYFISKAIYKIYLYIYISFFCVIIFINIIYYYIFISKVLNYLLKFLLTFQRNEINVIFQLNFEAKIDQYYSFFSNIVYLYIIITIIPIFIFLFMTTNFFVKFTQKGFIYRKYLYLLLLFIFLFIAPPDFYLQLIIFPYIIIVLETYIYVLTYFFIIYKIYIINNE